MIAPDFAQFSFSDRLALLSLLVTVLLGLLAIVVSIRADTRARRASNEAAESLVKVDAAVQGLPDAVSQVQVGVAQAEEQVHELRDTVLMFYRDVLGLVGASLLEFGEGRERVTHSASSSLMGRDEHLPQAPMNADSGKSTKQSIRAHEDPEEHQVPTQAASAQLREQIVDVMRSIGGGRPVAAGQVVAALPQPADLFQVLHEMYRLRLSRQVAWRDPILAPETLVELEEPR